MNASDSVYPRPGEATLVLYDLRDTEAWERAGRESKAWGKPHTTIYSMGAEHLLIEYRAGGARSLGELA